MSSKDHPDVNDTLRSHGLDAVRKRHDEAHGGAGKKNRGGSGGSGSDDKQQPPSVLPPPSDPMAVAHQFVEYCCLHEGAADALTLRYWRGAWWAWRRTHWAGVEYDAVRSLLYRFTEHAVYATAKDFVPWLPTRHKIRDLQEALSALLILSNEFDQPSWLDHRDIAGPIVATENGLLDISTRTLHQHTPLFFNVTSVPFAYDPNAPKPQRWLKFLDELWPQEPDAIDVLGEWFGYVVSGRLDLQKIFMTVGPTRGGKGVIARVESAMIGKRNVCGPTLSSLGGEFGLAPLMGKSLAIISDARFVGKNGGVVVERLLSISGEDALTVNIKYREQWTGKLPCRLHIISNELPKLGDASSAVIGRIVLLQMTRSWLGKEDHGLEPTLLAELPGILNWSLAGLERLTFENGNVFTRVAAVDEAITEMRNLSSPVGAFVREMCEVKAGNQIDTDVIFEAYRVWCTASDYPKSAKHVFGKDLRAAVPCVTQPGGRNQRTRFYSGIALRSENSEDAEIQENLMSLRPQAND